MHRRETRVFKKRRKHTQYQEIGYGRMLHSCTPQARLTRLATHPKQYILSSIRSKGKKKPQLITSFPMTVQMCVDQRMDQASS